MFSSFQFSWLKKCKQSSLQFSLYIATTKQTKIFKRLQKNCLVFSFISQLVRQSLVCKWMTSGFHKQPSRVGMEGSSIYLKYCWSKAAVGGRWLNCLQEIKQPFFTIKIGMLLQLTVISALSLSCSSYNKTEGQINRKINENETISCAHCKNGCFTLVKGHTTTIFQSP